MADNVTLPAAGTSVAADEIGGVLYQRVKNTFGADGTATDVSANTPMPVTIDSGALLAVLEELAEVIGMLRTGAGSQLPDGYGRTRVSVDNIGSTVTIPTVTTVSAVSRVSAIGNSGMAATGEFLAVPIANGPPSDLYRNISVQ